MNSEIPSSLPEPDVPESCLIRQSAPAIALSAGLKERVLRDCAQQMSTTAKVRRVVMSASALAVAALLLMCVMLADSDEQPTSADSSSTPSEGSYQSSGELDNLRPGGPPTHRKDPSASGIAIGEQGMPTTPNSNPGIDENCAEEIIEQLRSRRQFFDAGMLPRIP